MAIKTAEPTVQEVFVDPSDVLMDLPRFMILRNGTNIQKEGKVIRVEKMICVKCGKTRKEHDHFIDGLCTSCHTKELVIPPPEEPQRDHCHFEGSSAFKEGEFIHDSVGDEGKLILYNVKGSAPLVYLKVPHSVWMELVSAKSVGKFYNQRIKNTYLQQLK